MSEPNLLRDTRNKIETALSPYISEPLEPFIERLSNIYHSYEAERYDVYQHSLADAEQHWQTILNQIPAPQNGKLRLLDYGAGTGFATQQVLSSHLRSTISEVVCYDLSREMLNVCQQKFKSFDGVSFTFLDGQEGKKRLVQMDPFDLVVTNALLHHLLDLDQFCQAIGAFIRPSGYYLAGHEPNRLFYYNQTLLNWTYRFQKYKRLMQAFSLQYWAQKLRFKPRRPDLATLTNQTLLAQQLIQHLLPCHFIHKLVDIHVPIGRPENQPWGLLGLDSNQLGQWLGSNFRLKSQITYSHIKDGLASRSWVWRPLLSKLAHAFPDEGADAIFLFHRL